MTSDPASVSVLFVCMGNICRSPAAEIIFTRLLEENQLQSQIWCDSAGTTGYHTGNPPDSRMAQTLRARGYRIFGKARQITRADMEEFDHILVADQDNLRDLRELDRAGKFADKIRLLTDFCAGEHPGHVPDPYYGRAAGFERVADLVEDACAGLLAELRPENA